MREKSMGPQPTPPPERIPMGPSPEQVKAPIPGEQSPGWLPPEQMPEEERGPAPAYKLNTVPGSGNTTNNPGNNITARTLEEGAGLER